MTDKPKTILDDALAYHKRGWCIIPIPYGRKAARIRWSKYQDSRPDENQLRKWFAANNRNIAVVLGPVSADLACRDFDTMPEYERWSKAYTNLAKKLPTVRTAKGMHVYFEADIEGIKHIANGELRGKGGYCLLPPSVHPDGPVYQWVNPLSNGNLLVVDPELVGFMPDVTEHTEHIEQTEHTEAIVSKDCCYIRRVIARTLTQKYGQRNSKIFFLAKALRTRYPDANPKMFREDVRSWYDLALPNIRTKDFAETWLDFLIAWDNVDYFEGVNPMVIYEQAIKLEAPPIVALNYPDNRKIQNLAVLCREMQKACGDKPFFLSARTAAGLLEISAMQANRYLRLLVREDVLEIIEKGGTAQQPRKANQFRYLAN